MTRGTKAGAAVYPAGEPDDAALVARTLAGERDAFRLLVERHRVRVFNRCFVVVGSAADAEDVAQETFMRAYDNLAKYDPALPFAPWLCTIARNLALNHKTRRAPADPLPDEGRSLPAGPGADTARTVEERESVSAVRRAILAIQQEFREVLALRYVDELGYQEIADRLKIPMGTVKSRIFKGRDRLIELLKGGGT